MELIVFLILVLIALIILLFVKDRERSAELEALRRSLEELSRNLSRLETEHSPQKSSLGQTTAPVKPEPAAPAVPGPPTPSVPAPSAPRSPEPAQPVRPAPPASAPPPLPVSALKPAPPTMAPAAERGRPPVTPEPKSWSFSMNWEQFMGVKLFAWAGGLALFLAVACWLKYAFEHDLISPATRVILGFLAGFGLVGGSIFTSLRRYIVTSQTLCATGIVILYGVTFAAHALYELAWFQLGPTFILMTALTALAFFLAVRLNAIVVAVLGLLGGFLTPVLLSTGKDNPTVLFSYIAVLDTGLVLIALRQRWHFLVSLAALATFLTQVGWIIAFFEAAKALTAMTVLAGFDLLFVAAFAGASLRQVRSSWLAGPALALPAWSLAFTFYLFAFPEIAARPGLFAWFLLLPDLCLLSLVWLDRRLSFAQAIGGGLVFLILGGWLSIHLTTELLYWGLGLVLLFAVLHAGYPLWLHRRFPDRCPAWWSQASVPVALLLMLIPILALATDSVLFWLAILLLDTLAVLLALFTAPLLGLVAVLMLTLLAAGLWIFRMPEETLGLTAPLVVIGGFACFFFLTGLLLARKVQSAVADQSGSETHPSTIPVLDGRIPDALQLQLPAVSAALPFLLLCMLFARLDLPNPSPVFALGLALVVLILWVSRWLKMPWLPMVALGCAWLLQAAWQIDDLDFQHYGLPLAWHLCFYTLLAAAPFLPTEPPEHSVPRWVAGLLSGPVHFLLVYRLFKLAVPNDFMGLIPAAFAVPALLTMAWLLRLLPQDHPRRNVLLAWAGGVTLFFITLIFPVQFEREWITIGWALEGAALLWLFRRIPHPGLRLLGIILLLVASARLMLNPAVLSYHPRGELPILNWYLYSYGLVIAALFSGAWFIAPPRHLVLKQNAPPVLYGLGAVLAFLLLNIEIADFFTPSGQSSLTFEFSGNFARDMTYSLAWALFALGLLVVGIARRLRAARYPALGLLALTLLKLFFHDLARLDQLYRIGALIGVAIVAILASFLYQRFLGNNPEK